MRNNSTRFIVQGAMIAALYTALTHISNIAGLASGAVQIRLSEALTVLPAFIPAAVPGLTLGCLISNLTTGCVPWDILGGTAATFLGAAGTYLLRKFPLAAPIPPILSNTLIIPFVLSYAYRFEGSIPCFMLTVGVGELAACGVLGTLLSLSLKKHTKQLGTLR